MIYVDDNARDARAGAEQLLWYLTANKIAPHEARPMPTLDDQMVRGNELNRGYDTDRMKALRVSTPDRQLASLGSFGFEFVR